MGFGDTMGLGVPEAVRRCSETWPLPKPYAEAQGHNPQPEAGLHVEHKLHAAAETSARARWGVVGLGWSVRKRTAGEDTHGDHGNATAAYCFPDEYIAGLYVESATETIL